MKTTDRLKEIPLRIAVSLLLLLVGWFASHSVSTAVAGEPESIISQQEKQQIIDFISIQLNDAYVFSDIAQKLSALLHDNLKAGKYDLLTTGQAFGQAITKDLRTFNNDRHLWIWYNPDWVRGERARTDNLAKGIDSGLDEAEKGNFGFREVSMMDGNVGYLAFNEFSEYPEAHATVTGAFQFLQHCDALLIDLRENRGGAPEMVQFLCSYFFDKPSVHLNSLQYKEAEKTVQYWSYLFVPGPRIPTQPVYVLVSEQTASAAEEFAYNLQNLGRATIVGETTRGAAHHNAFIIINDNYFMSVPIARAVNPITGTNWEGTGVQPDVPVEAEYALDKAYELAIRKLMAQCGDNDAKQSYERLLKSN